VAFIVMTDDGVRFDGRALGHGPLGGAETAFASLALALAGRGHRVAVRNNCAGPDDAGGVDWAPLAAGVPDACDLYIANRGDRLLPLAPGARARVFWIHNPARYLLKWRYLAKLWRWRPAIVFSGAFHAASLPRWAPAGARVTIPYGVSDCFLAADAPAAPPAPRAVFTSNPLRSLDWLLDLWVGRIRPRVPGAELHVFSGPETYRGLKPATAERMRAVLARAAALGASGVAVRGSQPKEALAHEFAAARAMLYRGDPGETFCLAVAEAQAAGVPCVVGDIGCVGERVIDGVTGRVAASDAEFADAAVALLADDGLWRRQSAAARARQRRWTWPAAAEAFERLLPGNALRARH
jgi:glycosyltransferase involved in cell wall biosynthesis